MDNKVMVKNMASAQVGFNLPYLHARKDWPQKGVTLPVDKDILREAIYDPGVEYLFKSGVLVIVDDLEFEKELGLEPEDTEVHQNVVELDDKKMKRAVSIMPMQELKELIEKLSDFQKQELADYAINHYKEVSMSRVDYLSEVCGRNLLEAIKVKKQTEAE